MSRLTTVELYALAGFEKGEVAASGPLRSAFCSGTATVEQLAEYSQYANKWNEYARLEAERDQAAQLAASAPDPSRHSGDIGLGSALADLRAGQAGRAPVVKRPQMVRVDVGGGGMMDFPEQAEWPKFHGSSSSSGHERIAAGLNSADKRR